MTSHRALGISRDLARTRSVGGLTRPWGAVVAALFALGLVTGAPAEALDTLLAARARLLAGKTEQAPLVVAVNPADAELVARVQALAMAAGASRVEGPSTAIPGVGPSVRVVVRELDGRALVEGTVPAALLAGQDVIVDARTVGRIRAAARVLLVRPPTPGLDRGLTALGALLALFVALAAARLSPLRMTAVSVGALALVVGVGFGSATAGVAVPFLELGGALGGALLLGWLDSGREARAALRALASPLLRATTPPRPGDTTAAAAIGAVLAELLDAKALLLLVASPGTRQIRVGAGYRLRAADLRAEVLLDARHAPFRDARGLARVADASSLLASEPAAQLLPLISASVVEGWLLLVPLRDAGALERAPTAVEATTTALAQLLCHERLAGEGAGVDRAPERDLGRRLVEAARRLDDDVASFASVGAHARAGWLVASAAGVTRWKNPRFDEILAHAAPDATGDLARIVALVARPKESPLATLERLLNAQGAVRAASATTSLVVTVTPLASAPGRPASSLLIEVDTLDATMAAQIVPMLSTVSTSAAAVPMSTTGKHAALAVVPADTSHPTEATTSTRAP